MSVDSLVSHYDETFLEKGGELYEPLSGFNLAAHNRRSALLDGLELPDLSDKTVVDYGIGAWGFGCIYPRLKACRRAIGFDISKFALERSRKLSDNDPALHGKDIQYLVSTGYALDLPDECVDIFFCGECIEHIEDTPAFLTEIYRVVKTGGLVIFTTPNASPFVYRNIGLKWCVGFEHVALMDFHELDASLRKFFKPVKYLGFNQTIAPDIDQYVSEAIRDDWVNSCEDDPENATGLIAVVRKDSSTSFPPQRIAIVDWREAQLEGEVEALTLQGATKGGMIRGESRFIIEVPTFVQRCNLIFWAHSWSGFAEISCGGLTKTVNLYSNFGGCERVILEDLPGDKITIRPLGMKDRRSASDQVILFRAVFAGPR